MKTKNDKRKCDQKAHHTLSSSQYCPLENFILTCDYLRLYEEKDGIRKYPIVGRPINELPGENSISLGEKPKSITAYSSNIYKIQYKLIVDNRFAR